MKVAAVVLAAGGSTRLGRPKQFVRFAGETLIRRAVRTANDAVGREPVVVAGEAVDAIRAELTGLPATVVENADWRTGMASSLIAGLNAAVAATPEIDALLITLCDQPFVVSVHLRRLIEQHWSYGLQATASQFHNSCGPPAVFSRELFDEIRQLKGEMGAKRILTGLGDRLACMDLPEAGVDIDWPEDLKQLDLADVRGNQQRDSKS